MLLSSDPKIQAFEVDYMEFMKGGANKSYDLAIVDPPYGIGVGTMAYLKEIKTTVKQKNGKRLNANENKIPYANKKWDSIPPPQKYFEELKRVSVNQIIFGIDHMDWKGIGKGRIKWNKGVPAGLSFKPYEIAYCSMIDYEIEIPLLWTGMNQAQSLENPMIQQGNKKLNEKRIHPTQKPVLLYTKLLKMFAKSGFKILDTHGGSMSIAIACYNLGFDLDICEMDADYFKEATDRVKAHIAKPKGLFTYKETMRMEPNKLF